jgi:hypothetical protein
MAHCDLQQLARTPRIARIEPQGGLERGQPFSRAPRKDQSRAVCVANPGVVRGKGKGTLGLAQRPFEIAPQNQGPAQMRTGFRIGRIEGNRPAREPFGRTRCLGEVSRRERGGCH